MPIKPGSLGNFTCRPFRSDGTERATYRRGEGPGVVILHEAFGLTPEVLGLAERVAAHGFHVALPNLFGRPGYPGIYNLGALVPLCIRREFRVLASNETSPITDWLRALCRDVHREQSGNGVGVIGLCLTGNFALALMVEADGSVVAPVMGHPSLPLPLGRARRAAVHLSPTDLAAVRNRLRREELTVLGVRFTHDGISPAERFATLRRELGEDFEELQIDSSPCNPYRIRPRAHSVLTADLTDEEGHPTRQALDRIAGFLRERLSGPDR